MGFKKRMLSLVPGHKAAETDSDAAEPQDAFGLHLLYDGTKHEAESSLARDGKENAVCLEPCEYARTYACKISRHRVTHPLHTVSLPSMAWEVVLSPRGDIQNRASCGFKIYFRPQCL